MDRLEFSLHLIDQFDRRSDRDRRDVGDVGGGPLGDGLAVEHERGVIQTDSGDAAWISATDQTPFEEGVDAFLGVPLDVGVEIEFRREPRQILGRVDRTGRQAEFAVEGVVGGLEFVFAGTGDGDDFVDGSGDRPRSTRRVDRGRGEALERPTLEQVLRLGRFEEGTRLFADGYG